MEPKLVIQGVLAAASLIAAVAKLIDAIKDK